MVSQPKLVSAGCHQCLLQDFTGAVDRHAAHQTSGTVFFFIFSNVDRSSGDETSGVGGDVTAPPVCLCLLSGPAPSPCSSSLLSEPRPLLLQSQGGAQRRWVDDTGCWWHHFLFISTTLRSSGLLHPCVIGGFWQEASEKIGTCTFGAKLRPPVVNIFMHLSSCCAL